MSGEIVPSWPKNLWDSPLFHLLFSKPHFSSQKPLKNLSFFSTFRPQNLNFLTPFSEIRTPESSLFWPPESEKSSLFGVTFHYFWHFFKFFDTFLSFCHFFKFLTVFVGFCHFFLLFWGVTFCHFFTIFCHFWQFFTFWGHFFTFRGGRNRGQKRSEKEVQNANFRNTYILETFSGRVFTFLALFFSSFDTFSLFRGVRIPRFLTLFSLFVGFCHFFDTFWGGRIPRFLSLFWHFWQFLTPGMKNTTFWRKLNFLTPFWVKTTPKSDPPPLKSWPLDVCVCIYIYI